MQDLFAREHNAIAAAIAAGSPHLSDERIFRKARLATSAVIAKIHTIDWTVEVRVFMRACTVMLLTQK